MREFPKLKTGAVAQCPYTREVSSRVRVLPFLDGTEQRYALRKPRRRWLVRLELLDEGEAARVESFAASYLDTLESFTFVDPWDGQPYEGCVIEGEDLRVVAEGESRCRMTLVIAQECK